MLRPRLVCPADLPVSERPSFLWEGRIPFGAVSILEGDPQCAKSTLLYFLAAQVTSGRALPLDQPAQEPMGVVLLEAEDQIGTIERTLRSSGADLNRLRIMEKPRAGQEPLQIPRDLDLVRQAIDEVSARLVVFNPLTSFLQGNVTQDQRVRQSLMPLVAMAEELGVAVVLVRHLTKAAGHSVLCAGAGSMGLVGLCRSSLVITDDPDRPGPFNHVIALSKSNLASAPGICFRTVRTEDGVIRPEWIGTSPHTAQELWDAPNQNSRADTAIQEACRVLKSILDDGPIKASETVAIGKRSAISERTLKRAKQHLGVRSRKSGSGKSCCWYWELPHNPKRLRPYEEADLAETFDQLTGQLNPLPFDVAAPSEKSLFIPESFFSDDDPDDESWESSPEWR